MTLLKPIAIPGKKEANASPAFIRRPASERETTSKLNQQAYAPTCLWSTMKQWYPWQVFSISAKAHAEREGAKETRNDQVPGGRNRWTASETSL
jgi:hypothetical protein